MGDHVVIPPREQSRPHTCALRGPRGQGRDEGKSVNPKDCFLELCVLQR